MHTGPYPLASARCNGTFLGRGVIGHVVVNRIRFGQGVDAKKRLTFIRNIA